jgi:hypothetical protein
MKSAKLKQVVAPKRYNIIIGPEAAARWDEFTFKNMPPAYSQMFVEFLKQLPKEEIK